MPSYRFFIACALLAILQLGDASIVSAQNAPADTGPILARHPADIACCDSIEQSLRAAAALSAGKTRKEVEIDWRGDGGIQSRTMSRYVFRQCSNIKIDVELKLSPSAPKYGWSDDDVVVKVSKPYLEAASLN